LRGAPSRSTLTGDVTPNRLILLALTLVAVLTAATVAGLQGATGVEHLALDAMPFLLVAGLLVSGRFVGEERILARRRARRPVRPRPERRPRPRRRDRALAALLERSLRTLRGPPAPVAAA
jgi:hypothetical protein